MVSSSNFWKCRAAALHARILLCGKSSLTSQLNCEILIEILVDCLEGVDRGAELV